MVRGGTLVCLECFFPVRRASDGVARAHTSEMHTTTLSVTCRCPQTGVGALAIRRPGLDPADDRNAQLRKVLKEGWNLGVTLANAAEMGDLKFLCTSMEEPGGDLEMLVESMNATNADRNMQQKLNGCSSHVGKMMVSASNSQLAIVA